MATEDRHSDPSVETALFAQPWRFGFFQAVRLLRLLLRRAGLDQASDAHELLRFRTPISLDFPASEIQALVKPPEDAGDEHRGLVPIEMTVNFMGLTGPSGVLPNHYTETLIAARAHYKDSIAHQFFDLFSHRLIAIFARAWEKYRHFVAYERGQQEGFTNYLLDLVGIGTPQLRGRLADRGQAGVHDHALAYYSGLIAQRPHSATALASLLSDYFHVPVRIEQFCGQWLRLPLQERTILGRTPNEGTNISLGDRALLGERAWDQQSKFRVVVGPLTRRQLFDFLPDGQGYKALRHWARFFVNVGLEYDLQLVVKKDQVPECKLGDAATGGARLGWTSWLRYEPFEALAHDPDDVVLAA